MDWNRAAKERLRYVRVSLAGDGDSESVTALDAALAEIKRLERHKLWMEETSESEEDGWCPTHPRRFAVNARDDGDECQVCRAESAERELQAQRERADRAEAEVAACHRQLGDYVEAVQLATELADRLEAECAALRRQVNEAMRRSERDHMADADRIATLEAALREWWKLSLVVESSIREELHRDSRARETYESVCAAITATRVALAAQPATATIKESLMVHPFQPCPLDESTPGHNFTCALLCGVCGLPREKHVSQEVPRG